MTITDHPTETRPTTSTAPAGAGRHWTGAPDDAAWIDRARTLAPHLRAGARQHDRSGDFVRDGIELARTEGFLTMLVPAEVGGGGASHAEACAALAELARGCPATALTLSMHTHLVAAQVWRHHRGLPAPVLGKVADQQLMLISTGASDWLGSSGSARPVDGGYRVSARKLPASGCPAGDVLVTSIRWDDAPDGPQVIHAAVPFATDGVHIDETWDAMGMRGTGSHTVVLDEVFVPESAVALVRPADAWHPVWASVLGAALPLIMACYVGVAEELTATATELAVPRADRPGTATTIGRLHNQLTVARDSVRAMIDASDDLRFDNTLEHALGSLTRKTNAAEAVGAAARLALEAGGGRAFSATEDVERLFRDAHGGLYHPLPAAEQHVVCGRAALGLDPLSP